MENLIAIIGSFLAGLAVLAPFLLKFRNALKAVKEVLDVPYAAGQVSDLADKALEDKVLTEEEVKAIAAAVKNVKVQYDEAKAALQVFGFFKKK